jgi:hypothetical protein
MSHIATTDDAFVEMIESSEDLRPKTRQIYIGTLRVLQKLCEGMHGEDGVPSFGWLVCNPKLVIRKIFKTYDNNNTRRRFIAAVRSLFKLDPEIKERYPGCDDKWKKSMTILDDAYREQAMSAQLTDRERKNWVPWSKILEKEAFLAETEYGSFDHLLLAMYCLIEPLRQNFGNVRIFIKTVPPVVEESADGNYIVMLGKHRADLVLNDYKTSSKYGTFQRNLPEKLVRIIEKSLTEYPRKFLFVDSDDAPYIKQNSFTQYSNRTLHRIFGVRITVSILRHSFISNLDFNEELPSSLFQKAKNMGHSIGMQQQYRKRAPREDIEARPPPPAKPAIRSSEKGGERIVVIRM